MPPENAEALAVAYLGGDIPRFGGACFTVGTLLLTEDGTKPIEQFVCGDVVLARDEHDSTG